MHAPYHRSKNTSKMIPLYVIYVEKPIAQVHVPLELLDTRRDTIPSFCSYKHIGILFNGINDRVNLQLLCSFLNGSAKFKPKFIVVATRHPIEEWKPHDDTYRSDVASYKSILRTNARKATWAAILEILDDHRGRHDNNFRAANKLLRELN